MRNGGGLFNPYNVISPNRAMPYRRRLPSYSMAYGPEAAMSHCRSYRPGLARVIVALPGVALDPHGLYPASLPYGPSGSPLASG